MSIPKLRFNEFVDNWKQNKIGDISNNITAGATPSTLNKDYWGGNIRWMNSGELNLKKVFEVENRITELGLKKSSTKLLPKKCVLIGLAGQGKTRGTVAMNMVELCTNQSIAAIHPNSDKFNEEFLYHNLDNRYDELRGLSTGDGGRGGLNLQIIKSMTIFLPSLKEQTKIANFLTAVDEKITQLTQKHELLTQYKKGVMQQIFSQELRFKDDDGGDFPKWEETTLNAIAKIVGGGTPDTAIEDYWQGSIQWFTPTELKTKYVSESKRKISDSGLKNSSAKVLPAGTLLLSSRATVGDVSIALNECTTNQGFQSLIVNDENNNEFVYYWLTNNKKSLLEKASGSTFLEISKREIEKLVIQKPVKKEQIKVANFLTSIDDKITATQAQIQAMKQYKQGLLQQMFV